MANLFRTHFSFLVSALLAFSLSEIFCQAHEITPTYAELVRAVKRDDTAQVRTLLHEGVRADRPQITGGSGSAGEKTPLMIAAEHGNLTILKLLLMHGANVEERATGGYFTPLYYAVEKGRNDCVKALLAKGADPNTANIDGEPVLLLAAKHYPEIARILILKGANVNGQDITGGTVLIYAVEGDHVDLVRFLLMHGADVHRKDEGGDTALSIAKKHGNKSIIRLLQSAGSKPVLK